MSCASSRQRLRAGFYGLSALRRAARSSSRCRRRAPCPARCKVSRPQPHVASSRLPTSFSYPQKQLCPLSRAQLLSLRRLYFFLAAFFLDAFFFAFFAFAAMLKLRSRVSPGTEYIHDKLIYKQYMALRHWNVLAM